MKAIVAKALVLFLGTLLLVACNNNAPKPTQISAESSLPSPTKDILVTDGDLNKKYNILGQVEYTPEGEKSIYSDRIDGIKQNKEMLKKVAFAKYGDKLDAIIHFKTNQSINGGFWGAVGAGYGAHSVASQVEGIAVSFLDSEKETSSTDKSQSTSTSAKGKSKSRKK